MKRCWQFVVYFSTFLVLGSAFFGTAVTVLAQESNGKDGEVQTKKLLLAHYMPWYQAKPFSQAWGWHWTMNKFNPDATDTVELPGSAKRQIASHFYPLIGPYDSADPAVLECQLLQMKLAGVDGVIVDWYGLTDLHDYAVLHRSTEQLIAQVMRFGMRFAICYEDSTVPALIKAGMLDSGQRVGHVAKEIDWLTKNWFNRKGYVHLEGKPVLLSFGQGGLSDSEWTACLTESSQPIAYFSEHQKRTSAMGAFDWPIPKEGIAAVARFEGNAKSWPESIAVAFPRFVDIYAEAGVHESWGRVEDQQGAVFRQTLRRAYDGNARLIQIATWNDWGEGTNVEPSREFGYRDLETIQLMRKTRAGGAFRIQADDLRLPAELLTLRHRYKDDAATGQLDQIAELLSSGEVELARRGFEKFSSK
ncbi:glycoside hydrolase family 71/99-like protein [Rhodopirellula sp.]|nr:glycoside hydrolase family 71/99-like protein [Rhodopirellula sp.]